MKDAHCRHCGNKALVRGMISIRCPICGECEYLPEADDALLWSEHRLGLMFLRDGWRWMGVLDPPDWFLENMV